MYIATSESLNLASIDCAVRKHGLLTFTGRAVATANIKVMGAGFTATDGRHATFYRSADTLLQIRKA